MENKPKGKDEMKFKWLWHEPSNIMCVADLSHEGLPLITICEDDVAMINPYYSYPYTFLLDHYGFVEIGEI